MRVLLVLHEFPKASEAFLVDQFLGLLERGVDAQLLAEIERPEAYRLYPQLSAPDVRRRIHTRPGRERAWRLPFVAAARLARAFPRAPLTTLRALLGEVLRSPIAAPGRLALGARWIALAPDLVHFEFGTLAAHWIDWPRWTRTPFVASFRGFDLESHALDEPGFYDRVWREASGLHVLGEDLAGIAAQRGWDGSVPLTRITPAVDSQRFDSAARPGRALGTADAPLRIVSVGRLHPKKGHEFALRAVRALVDEGRVVEHRVVGEGPLGESLRALARELELEGIVTWTGALPRSAVVEELGRADVLLHASIEEGFGNAVLEAQACGLPVVCSDATGLGESVAHGETGFVLPRRDPAALADALGQLAMDGELRQRMGAAGRARVLARFTPAAQLDAFLAFYERALRR